MQASATLTRFFLRAKVFTKAGVRLVFIALNFLAYYRNVGGAHLWFRRHRALAGMIVNRQAMNVSGLPGGAPLDLGLIHDCFTVQFDRPRKHRRTDRRISQPHRDDGLKLLVHL